MRGSRLSESIIFAMAAMLLAACGRSVSPTSQPTVTPIETIVVEQTRIFALPPTPPPCTPSTFDSFPNTLDPCSRLIQLRWLGWVETEPVPEFTLLADGNVYYRDGQTIVDEYYRGGETMVAHLKSEEALALVQRILDLGFECLQDGLPCRPESGGRMSCFTDQSFWYLELRLPNGELRGIHDYYEIVDTPAAFERIQNELISYRHPEAQPYSRGAACPSGYVECCTDLGNIR